MPSIRILVVDDHQLFREAIISKLIQDNDFQVIGEVDNGIDALMLIKAKKPDVVLMDISMVGMDGLETTRLISAAKLKTKIIILSMHSDRQYVGEALAQHVSGYVCKQEAFADLTKAIRSVMDGQDYYSPSLNVEPSVGKVKKTTEENLLTRREKEVVILVAKGLSNQKIADLSKLSIKTVETHRSNIYRKLDARNSADLTRYAIRTGLITP